jgi:hypothetical protein
MKEKTMFVVFRYKSRYRTEDLLYYKLFNGLTKEQIKSEIRANGGTSYISVPLQLIKDYADSDELRLVLYFKIHYKEIAERIISFIKEVVIPELKEKKII